MTDTERELLLGLTKIILSSLPNSYGPVQQVRELAEKVRAEAAADKGATDAHRKG